VRSLQTAVSGQCASVCQLERPLPVSHPGWLLSACKRAGRNSSRARLAVSLLTTHEVRLGRIGQRHVSSPDIALCVVRRSYTCRIFHPFF